MKAHASVVALAGPGGTTVVRELRSCAPLVLRETPGALYLVGGAAGPLGGDDLSLRIVVGAGATVVIRSSAAAVALPGPGDEESRFSVEAEVSGSLTWAPEPSVAAAGCWHRQSSRLVLASGAVLSWREEIVLGRHGEVPGSWASHTSLDVDGGAVLRQELALGPCHSAFGSPAVAGEARAVGSVLMSHPRWRDQPAPTLVLGDRSAVLGLAGPAAQVTALADDAPALREQLTAGLAALGVGKDQEVSAARQ